MPSAYSDGAGTSKRVLVYRSGPAFDSARIERALAADVQAAHAVLDLAGSPRKQHGRDLNLTERVTWLHITHLSLSQTLSRDYKKLNFRSNLGEEAG